MSLGFPDEIYTQIVTHITDYKTLNRLYMMEELQSIITGHVFLFETPETNPKLHFQLRKSFGKTNEIHDKEYEVACEVKHTCSEVKMDEERENPLKKAKYSDFLIPCKSTDDKESMEFYLIPFLKAQSIVTFHFSESANECDYRPSKKGLVVEFFEFILKNVPSLKYRISFNIFNEFKVKTDSFLSFLITFFPYGRAEWIQKGCLGVDYPSIVNYNYRFKSCYLYDSFINIMKAVERTLNDPYSYMIHIPRLKEMKLEGFRYEDNEPGIAMSLPDSEKLSVSFSDFDVRTIKSFDAAIYDFFTDMNKLKDFELLELNSSMTHFSKTLKDGKLDFSFVNFLRKCPNLKMLNLTADSIKYDCINTNDEILVSKLENLSISNNKTIFNIKNIIFPNLKYCRLERLDYFGSLEFLEDSKDLKELEIVDCNSITFISNLKLPKLEKFKLCTYPSSYSSTIIQKNDFENLNELYLRIISNSVSFKELNIPKLKKLTYHCKANGFYHTFQDEIDKLKDYKNRIEAERPELINFGFNSLLRCLQVE